MSQSIKTDFEWKPEYDSLLEHIALTDEFETEWTRLREIIRHKIEYNIRQYLSGELGQQGHVNIGRTPEPLPRSSPISLPSSPSPFISSPVSSTVYQGLVIPAFPKRERRKDAPMQAHNSIMGEKEAGELMDRIFEQLDEFDDPPFTIQRVCELCVQPRKHYKTVGKYLRAVERSILVTSTRATYLSEISHEDDDVTSTYRNMEAMRMASTPLMSPIPFLHDDARRSRSPSPFELATTRRLVESGGLNQSSVEHSSVRHPLGLVDELDDPKPGHLAERPTALTSVTGPVSSPLTPPLSERFVKSSSPDPEDGTKDLPETVESEDAEVEDMVLDASILEDEDKENRP